MSKLKIPDLSFCETELDNSCQVKGGMLGQPFSFHRYYQFLLPLEESEMEVLEESVTDGSRTTYFYDEETDSSGVLVSQESKTGKMMSVAGGGKSHNGRYAFASSSALNMS